MAVAKIDPKVIFASEAPVQDTPAVFTNKTVGWGESRKNGGRPTIKQSNALQQETDLKILWLNENAVTPFDATIDYPENAVTIKDGVFKILESGVWELFLDKSSVGLGNVDNTSDLNKPVSTATSVALNLKADKVTTYTKLEVDNLIDSSIPDEIVNSIGGESGAITVESIGLKLDERGYSAVSVQYGAINQEQFNDGLESIADMLAIENPKDGMRVFVKSIYSPQPLGTAYPYIGGGEFVFSTQTTKTSDGFIVVQGTGGKWVKKINNITVDDFGAIGDGSTDDSNAFQKMVDSPYSGHNVTLPNRTAEFVIKQTIDMKTKGLVGGGVSRIHVGSYERNCISVKDGTFTDNFAFINLRKTLSNIVIRDKTSTPKTLNCISLDAYDIDINNVVITDFYDQIHSKYLSVVFHVDRFHGIGAGNYPIHILEDGGTADSTTSSFTRCHFYYSKGSIKFDKGIYNASFTNLVVEYCDEGLTAGFFAGCVFDNLWFENTNTTLAELPVVINGLTSQQSHNNRIGSINTNPKWKYLYDMGVPAPANNFDGWGWRTGTFMLQNNLGGRMEIKYNSIKVLPNEWLDPAKRNLDISAAEVAAGSSRRSYLNLRANSGYVRFRDVSDTSVTPINISRQIGASATANTPLFGNDIHTVNQRAATYTEIGSGAAGHFDTELIVVYDSTKAGKQANGGWEIVRTDVGKFTLQRVTGNAQELQDSSLIISGIFSAVPLLHRVASTINSYSGSWTSYRSAAGYTIEFTNASGVLTDPTRFTLAFTMRL